MYPTIGHFLSDLFGTHVLFPLPTYGLMLASAFLSAFLVIRYELKRRGDAGLIPSTTEKVISGLPASRSELFTYGFFGFLIGFKLLGVVVDYQLFVQDVQGYVLSLQGNFFGGIVAGGLAVYYIYRNRQKEAKGGKVTRDEVIHPQQQAAAILLIAAFSGIVGAKIFHQLENFQEFLNDPIGSLFSAGGLTFYGGLIFGTIAVLWYIRKKKIPVAQMMDVAAPAILIAYGVGRMGCMVSGDGCWGVVNPDPQPEWLSWLPGWMWSFDYPNNVINSGVPIEGCAGHYCHVLAEPVWPTPFYEATLSTLFFIVLWSLRKASLVPGTLFGLSLIMNGITRFLIEKIRVNNKYNVGAFEFTQAEVISVLLVIAGIALILWLYNKKQHKRTRPEPVKKK
jgi:phosphatidylglycerol---prolipoprotein diacylglyceryl transferase